MGKRNNEKTDRHTAYALEGMAALNGFLFAILCVRSGEFGLCVRQQFFNELPFLCIGLDRQHFAVVIDVETSDELAHGAIPDKKS